MRVAFHIRLVDNLRIFPVFFLTGVGPFHCGLGQEKGSHLSRRLPKLRSLRPSPTNGKVRIRRGSVGELVTAYCGETCLTGLTRRVIAGTTIRAALIRRAAEVRNGVAAAE
jgi:hypothetical protein